MIARSRCARFGWLFAAMLQVLLPAFALVADARAEAESQRGVVGVHVERTGSTGCPRVHPADCAVCRLLATSAATAVPASVLAPVQRDIDATIIDVDGTSCAARFPGDPPPRAPPS